jgi:capsular exopolysaccharide synthesis family protein
MANYALDTPQAVEAGLTINDLVRVLRRRRNVGLIILGACFLITLLYCVTATKRYAAVSVIQVQKEGSSPIDLSDLGGPATGIGGDLAASNMNLETQSQILQSDTLALNVIRDLNLEATPDFKSHWNPISAVLGLFFPAPKPDPQGASLEDSPGRRTRAIHKFEKNLQIKVITGTRLIQVSYSDPDPKLSAAIVNRLVQGLTDFSFESKTASSSEASDFLQSQLADLRKQSEADQAKLASLQKGTDMFSLGTDSNGHEQLYSSVLDKLQQSTAALSAANQNRIVKEAVYKAVRSGNAELISELSGTAGAAGGAPVANSLVLIQNLRLQQSTLQQQIADGEQKYGTAYPRMAELHAQLDRVNTALNDEIARVATRAKNDYEIAVSNENQIRAENEANHRAADNLKDKAVDYTIQRDEANQSRTLYEDLLKKLKETGVLKGLKGGDLSIVDPARVPANPSKPNTVLLLAASIAVGLLFAFGGMLIAEGLDRSIHTTAQIEQMGLPLLGILPAYGGGKGSIEGMRGLRTLAAPRSAYSEAVRSIRSSIVTTGPSQHRVVVVTSANAHEGKSVTARNLAVSVAQQGKRVVLVDADFRSTADAGPEFTAKEGLSTLLAGPPVAPTLLQVPKLPNLFILPGGATPPNPAELLSSPRMNLLIDELKQQFELVLIDSPPVLPVVDAAILSALADSTVLVAHQGVTEEASLARAYQILAARAKPDSVAVVLNGVNTNSDLYHSYFGKTTANYYQEDAHESA